MFENEIAIVSRFPTLQFRIKPICLMFAWYVIAEWPFLTHPSPQYGLSSKISPSTLDQWTSSSHEFLFFSLASGRRKSFSSLDIRRVIMFRHRANSFDMKIISLLISSSVFTFRKLLICLYWMFCVSTRYRRFTAEHCGIVDRADVFFSLFAFVS